MRTLFVGLLFLMPVTVWAFLTVQTDQGRPYEIVPVEAPLGEARYFLGELQEYPIMYEVVAEEAFTFSAQVRQVAQQPERPFSLILIRQNDRGGGVSEVARMNLNPNEWTTQRDSQIGLTFRESPVLSESVEPGVYRIEISTPDNAGKYMLQIGDEPADTGYFTQLSSVRTTQRHFGYSIFSMIGSSLVFYPLGILVLLVLLYHTWRYRHVFANESR